jgi:hypothetical protein
MQHGEEEGAFDGEIKVTQGEQVVDNFLAAGFAPETFEDEGRSDAEGADGGGMSFAMRGEQEDVLGEACAGSKEAIELALFTETVEPSEGDEDALSGGPLLSGVFDDLEILPGPGLFDAEEHGGLLDKDTAIVTPNCDISRHFTD